MQALRDVQQTLSDYTTRSTRKAAQPSQVHSHVTVAPISQACQFARQACWHCHVLTLIWISGLMCPLIDWRLTD